MKTLVIDPTISKRILLSELKIGEKDINLPSWFHATLMEMGFSFWFPVQQEVISRILSNDSSFIDIVVISPTGSGKTISYAIPIISKIWSRIVPRTRALVVVPTRELALQVYSVFIELIKGCDLKAFVLISGGKNSFKDEQKMLMNDEFFSYDILIATPERLVDHLRDTSGFNISELEFLVIDEIDRLLENYQYQNWLSQVYRHTTEIDLIPNEIDDISIFKIQLRKLFFSATLTKNPRKLSQLALNDPLILCMYSGGEGKSVDSLGEEVYNDQSHSGTFRLQTLETIPRFQTPDTLKEFFVMVPIELKPIYLLSIIERHMKESFLVFVGSSESAEKLCMLLSLLLKEQNIIDMNVDFVSSEKGYKEKKKSLLRFNGRETRILVCSDALARGLDFPNVDVVINYDVPIHIRTYIHRVGRTARAGREGFAYTILISEETNVFKEIIKKSNKEIEKITMPFPSQKLKLRLEQCVNELSNK